MGAPYTRGRKQPVFSPQHGLRSIEMHSAVLCLIETLNCFAWPFRVGGKE